MAVSGVGPVGEGERGCLRGVGVRQAERFALLGGAAIDRFALVVPSAVARSQMRRQISRLDCQFFTEREPAIQWLGWTERMPIDCPA